MNKVEWLSRLVSFDTTSRNSNLDLIAVLQDWFKQHQIDAHIMKDPDEPKADLFATIPAKDGSVAGGLILSGHTDVVPVDGQQWDTSPFTAVTKGDRIYGRGTTDMKGFLAVALSLVPQFQQMKLPYPLHFAFSYDEEIGCRGVELILRDIDKSNIRPKACIVGEPTDMKPVVAHKGIQLFRVTLQGHASHSSLTPQGCNAVEHAARLICFLKDIAEKHKKHGPFDQAFDVPYTTVSTNMISGGNAYNTIPLLCEFVFEFRHLPQEEAKQIRQEIDQFIKNNLLPDMQKEYKDAQVKIHTIAFAPGLDIGEEESFVQLSRKVTAEMEKIKVAYATEAGFFQEAGVPTIICGPGRIEQAHRANEFIEINQLDKCEQFLIKMCKEFAK